MRHILYFFLLLVIAISGRAQTATNQGDVFPKRITVTGSAEMEIIPDEIYVQVTLIEYEKRGAGKIPLENIKAAFLNACRDAGIPDAAIAVASYEGYDRWFWRKRKKNPDLNASISYEIKFSNTTQVDALVDRLDDEATQSFSIIRTSHSNITAFRKELKIQAVKAAKEKSIYLAEAIGEKPGEAILINEPAENVDAFNARYLSNTLMEGKDKALLPTQTAYKKIKLRYEVMVVFALK